MIAKIIRAMAQSDAEFDGRPWLSMGREERKRYLDRAQRSLGAAVQASDHGEVLNLDAVAAGIFLEEDTIDAALKETA